MVTLRHLLQMGANYGAFVLFVLLSVPVAAISLLEKGRNAELLLKIPNDITFKGRFHLLVPGRGFYNLDKNLTSSDLTHRISKSWNVGRSLILHIHNVSSEDEGVFALYQSEVLLKSEMVLVVPENEDIQYNKSILVNIGDSVTFSYIAEGPCIWILLTYDGDRWTIRDTPEKRQSSIDFEIRNASLSDEGIYQARCLFRFDKINVIGNTTRVLVKDLQFTNQTQNSTIVGTEGHFLDIGCIINSAYQVKSLSIESSGKTIAYGKPPNIRFTTVPKRTDSRTDFVCKATIEDHKSIVAQTQILILYPPYVEIQVSGDENSLYCKADGYPANYTYVWNYVLDADINIQPVLGFSNGSISLVGGKRNGLYICTVSNGVNDIFGNHNQTGKLWIRFKDGCQSSYFRIVVTGSGCVLLMLVTIVVHILCFMTHKSRNNQLTVPAGNEYDEIGSIMYQKSSEIPMGNRILVGSADIKSMLGSGSGSPPRERSNVISFTPVNKHPTPIVLRNPKHHSDEPVDNAESTIDSLSISDGSTDMDMLQSQPRTVPTSEYQSLISISEVEHKYMCPESVKQMQNK